MCVWLWDSVSPKAWDLEQNEKGRCRSLDRGPSIMAFAFTLYSLNPLHPVSICHNQQIFFREKVASSCLAQSCQWVTWSSVEKWIARQTHFKAIGCKAGKQNVLFLSHFLCEFVISCHSTWCQSCVLVPNKTSTFLLLRKHTQPILEEWLLWQGVHKFWCRGGTGSMFLIFPCKDNFCPCYPC